jgi:hypothetical protein
MGHVVKLRYHPDGWSLRITGVEDTSTPERP